MRVAEGKVDIARDAHELGTFDFGEGELLWIFDDIVERCPEADALLELDQPRLLQEQQSPALIDGVVGDGDAAALRDLGEAFMLQGIKPKIGERAHADIGEGITAILDGIVEEGFVLEIVDVDVARLQRDVRRRPIAELDDLHVEPLCLCLFGGGGDRISVGAGGDADPQRVGRHGPSEREKRRCAKAGQQGATGRT